MANIAESVAIRNGNREFAAARGLDMALQEISSASSGGGLTPESWGTVCRRVTPFGETIRPAETGLIRGVALSGQKVIVTRLGEEKGSDERSRHPPWAISRGGA